LLWKTTTGKNIVIYGWLNGLSQELPNTIFIIIKLATITKLLSYQYAIYYYYYFAVENDHWENIVINGWLNGLSQELPNTIFIIIKPATTTKLLSYHSYTQKTKWRLISTFSLGG